MLILSVIDGTHGEVDYGRMTGWLRWARETTDTPGEERQCSGFDGVTMLIICLINFPLDQRHYRWKVFDEPVFLVCGTS